MAARWRRSLWGLKLLIGGALLVWLILTVDARLLVQRLSNVNLGWLVLVLVVPHLGILISCVKWHLLLRARGGRSGLWKLFRLYLMGTFFNSFFPSMVGGDVVRVYQLGRAEQDASLAVASVFLERYIGFAALVSMMPLALLLPSFDTGIPGLRVLLAVVLVAFLCGSWMLFKWGGEATSAQGNRSGLRARLLGVFRRSHWHIASFRGRGTVLAWSYVLSVLFYVSAGLTVWLAVKSIDAELPLTAALCLTPLVLFAGAMPVSINGLGVVELGYVVTMGLLGVAEADALSAAVLLRIRLLLTTAVGGILYIAYRDPVTSPGSPPITRDDDEFRHDSAQPLVVRPLDQDR
jgi:uncharacterized protein (TIRG00374 family)